MLKTTPRNAVPLAARRARAQAERESAVAELESIAAQQAARVAEAEAEGARQQAAQQQALARHAELAERVAEMEADERRLKEQVEELERRPLRALQHLVQDLDAYKPPLVRMSAEEVASLQAQLDAEIAADDRAWAAREEQERREAIDREWRRGQARALGALRALKEEQEQ